MKLTEIKKKALEIGIKANGTKKADLIRAIQKAEGNEQSYGSNDGSCPYPKCLWWDDCIQEYSRTC